MTTGALCYDAELSPSTHFEFYYLEMSHSQIDYTKVRPCHVKMQRRAKLVYTYHYIYAMLAMLYSSIMKRQSDWLSHGFKITTKYKYFVHMQIIGIHTLSPISVSGLSTVCYKTTLKTIFFKVDLEISNNPKIRGFLPIFFSCCQGRSLTTAEKNRQESTNFWVI